MALVIGSIDKMTGAEIYAQMDNIKRDYLVNGKNYEIAKEEIAIYVEEINRRGKIIAKKYKKRYNPITVGYVLR